MRAHANHGLLVVHPDEVGHSADFVAAVHESEVTGTAKHTSHQRDRDERNEWWAHVLESSPDCEPSARRVWTTITEERCEPENAIAAIATCRTRSRIIRTRSRILKIIFAKSWKSVLKFSGMALGRCCVLEVMAL